MAFYRAHYAPNNAILVVAGDVEPAEVRRLAEAHFGPIPAAGGAAARPPAGARRRVAARRVEMRDARVREPHVSRGSTSRRSAGPATRPRRRR